MHTSIFTPFPELSTSRLKLRQLEIADKEDIFLLRSNETVNRYLGRKKASSPEDAEQFIQKINAGIANNESLYWAITIRPGNQICGTICIWNIEPAKAQAEIGFELHPDFQGKGIMQEALAKLIDYGFGVMRLNLITGFVHPDNLRSIHLLEKNQFHRNIQMEEENKNQLDGLLIYSLAKA